MSLVLGYGQWEAGSNVGSLLCPQALSTFKERPAMSWTAVKGTGLRSYPKGSACGWSWRTAVGKWRSMVLLKQWKRVRELGVGTNTACRAIPSGESEALAEACMTCVLGAGGRTQLLPVLLGVLFMRSPESCGSKKALGSGN